MATAGLVEPTVILLFAVLQTRPLVLPRQSVNGGHQVDEGIVVELSGISINTGSLYCDAMLLGRHSGNRAALAWAGIASRYDRAMA